jgi:hypothetical protein
MRQSVDNPILFSKNIDANLQFRYENWRYKDKSGEFVNIQIRWMKLEHIQSCIKLINEFCKLATDMFGCKSKQEWLDIFTKEITYRNIGSNSLLNNFKVSNTPYTVTTVKTKRKGVETDVLVKHYKRKENTKIKFSNIINTYKQELINNKKQVKHTKQLQIN